MNTSNKAPEKTESEKMLSSQAILTRARNKFEEAENKYKRFPTQTKKKLNAALLELTQGIEKTSNTALKEDMLKIKSDVEELLLKVIPAVARNKLKEAKNKYERSPTQTKKELNAALVELTQGIEKTSNTELQQDMLKIKSDVEELLLKINTASETQNTDASEKKYHLNGFYSEKEDKLEDNKRTKMHNTEHLLMNFRIIVDKAIRSAASGNKRQAILYLLRESHSLTELMKGMQANNEDLRKMPMLKTKMEKLISKWTKSMNPKHEIVKKFIAALEVHEGNESIELLVKDLRQHSLDFLEHEKSLNDYKNLCLKSIKEHQKSHHKLHHKQPDGVYAHIVDAFKAMFRLFEVMFNHVTGYQSSMFKKADSALGKATKEFEAALKELDGYRYEYGGSASTKSSER